MKILNNLKYQKRYLDEIKGFIDDNPKMKVSLIAFTFFILVYSVSKLSEDKRTVRKISTTPSFHDGKILGNQKTNFLKSKERLLSKTAKKIMHKNKMLEEKLLLLEKRMEAKS